MLKLDLSLGHQQLPGNSFSIYQEMVPSLVPSQLRDKSINSQMNGTNSFRLLNIIRDHSSHAITNRWAES